MNWNHLQVFLAVHRTGSIRAAASLLEVSRSTVTRQLEAFQSSQGVTLFERTPDGVNATPVGEALIPIAERAEAEVLAAQRLFVGRDPALTGRLDVTVFDPAGAVLSPAFATFRREHPSVDLHVSTQNSLVSLQRRQADIAVRAIARPSEGLFGRRLGRLQYGVYGTPDVCASDDPPWVLWDEAMGAELTWTLARERSRHLKVAIRVEDVSTMVSCAAAGIGLALIPVALGASHPVLVERGRVPIDEAGIDVWILTHPDLRRSARVRAFMASLGTHAPPLLAPAPV